jgi:hypothetical protein
MAQELQNCFLANRRAFLASEQNPPWVEAEVATMAPGTVQLNVFKWDRRLFRYVKAGQYKQIIQSGFESNVFVGSSLINMYTKCVSMEDAL